MVTNLRTPTSTDAARLRAEEYLQSGESAVAAVTSAELCVREHPESAVWTAFITGLLLGIVAGWFAAERHEGHWYDELDGFAKNLGGRLRW